MRQTKNGASKHKFDLEAHNMRKGLSKEGKKVEKAQKVLCACGCGKMISPDLFKTGGAWHAERNSVAIKQEKIKNKLKQQKKA